MNRRQALLAGFFAPFAGFLNPKVEIDRMYPGFYSTYETKWSKVDIYDDLIGEKIHTGPMSHGGVKVYKSTDIKMGRWSPDDDQPSPGTDGEV